MQLILKNKIVFGVLILVWIIYFVFIYDTNRNQDLKAMIVSDKSETLIPAPAIISKDESSLGGIFFCPNFFEKNSHNPTFNQDISHNGKLMVEVEKTSLIIKRLSDGKEIRTVSEYAHNDPTKNLTTFYKPRFSLDDSKVYFIVDAWTTSTAIHELDLSTGKTRFITGGYDLIVIPSVSEKDTGDLVRTENYAGYLIAKQHKYFAGSGSYDWYWIINPKTGKNIEEPIGDSPWDFFDIWVCPGRNN